MPNIDAGCYFFTALVPVRNDCSPDQGGPVQSPADAIREYLELMPTALQDPPSRKLGVNSPFARNRRTHFARLVLLEQPHFNGRDPSNAVIDQIRNVDLLKPQAPDRLECPYLMVMFDYDLLDPSGAGEPQRYFEELWSEMGDELRAIFQHCYGFDDVSDGTGFAGYMRRCQVETTLSFHDYYWEGPHLKSLPFYSLLAIPVVALLLPLAAAMLGWIGWLWATIGAIVLPVLAGYAIYRLILAVGARPWQAPRDANLANVLKGLYLQQSFTDFAIAQQDRDQDAKGAAFRDFLATTRPANLDAPTQPPGVIRSNLDGEG